MSNGKPKNNSKKKQPDSSEGVGDIGSGRPEVPKPSSRPASAETRQQLPKGAEEIRRQAEKLVRTRETRSPENIEAMSPDEMRRTLHDLRVHQIQLEMQNEELLATQEELKASQDRYFDFYNLSPVGFITVSREGLILEANLPAATLLGASRSEMVKQPISRFILNEDQDIYYLANKQDSKAGVSQACELRMVKKDGTAFWARMETTTVDRADGAPVSRVVLSDITHRKRAEAELEQANQAMRMSGQEFRSLAEAVPQIVWATRADGWNIYFNQQWVDYTGMTLEESYGHGWNKPFHPDDKQRAWDAWQRATQHNERYSLECRLRRADGVYRWWLIRGVPMLGVNGEILKWFGTCTDIEEIKLAEAAMKEANDLLEHRVAERTAALSQSEAALKRTQEISHLGSWELDLTRNELSWSDEVYRIFGLEPQEFGATYEAFLDRVHPEDRAAVDGAYSDSVREGRNTYEIEHRVVRKNTGEVRWVQEKCRHIRGSNGNLIRSVGMVLDITERKRAEEILRTSEQRHRLLADTMLQGVVHQNADGRIIAMNPAAERILGKTREEFLGSSSVQEEHDTIRENGQPFPGIEHPSMVALQTGQAVRGVVMGVFNSRLGEYRWINIDAVPVCRPGEHHPSEVYAVFEDITARKQAQEALQASEERYRLLADNIDDFVALSDTGGHVVYLSPSYQRRLGLTLADLQAPGALLLTHPDDTESIRQARKANLAGRSTVVEYRIRQKDGDWIWTEGRCTPIRDADGRVARLLLVSRDITARKQAQEALRANEERLRMVLQASLMGTFEVDLVSGEGQWNDMEFELLGLKPGDVPPVPESFFRYVHPDDIEVVKSKWQEAMQGKTLDAEFRVIRTDGQVRWLAGRGKFIFADKPDGQGSEDRGPAMRFLGVNFDITDRKQAQAQAEEGKRILDALMESVPEGITIADAPDARIRMVSRYGQELLGSAHDGLTTEQVAAKWEVYHPDGVTRMADADLPLVRAIQRGEIVRDAELIQVSSGGQRLTLSCNAAPIHDMDRRVTGAVVAWHDITARKRVEEVQAFLAQTSSGSGSEPFFNSLARYLAKSLEMDFICIDRLEGDGLNAATLAVWCDGKFEDNVTYALKDTPCGDVVGNTVCCYPASVCQFFPRDQVLKDLHAESYVGVTLWGHAGRPIGLIAAIARKPLTKRELAETVLKQVAIRAAGELERQQAETELRASEMRFRAMAESIPQLTWIAQPDGHIIWYNQRWYDYTGTTPEQMEGWGWQSVHDPIELPKVLERWKASIATGDPFEMTFPLRGADGIFRSFLTRVIPLKDATGCVMQWFGTNTDVDELKRTEAELRVSEERFRNVFEHAATGIAVTDMNGRFVQCNAAYCSMLGYSEEELRNIAFSSLVHPEDAERNMVLTQQMKNGEIPGFDLENRYIHKNGNPIWVHKYVSVLRDPQGKPTHVVALVTDMTERKLAEAERQKFVSLADQSTEFIGICNMQLMPFYANQAGMRLLGLDNLEQAIHTPVTEFFFPEDQKFIREEFFPCVLREGRAEVEIRFRHFKTGEAIWMIYNVFFIRDAEGNKVGLATVSRNINRRKRAEAALDRALTEARQRAGETEAVLAAMNDAVLVYNADMNVIRVNPGFIPVYGFDPMGLNVHDVIVKTQCRQIDGSPLPLESQPTPRALRGEAVVNQQFRITRLDGQERVLETSATPLRVGKQITGTVTVWHDITERQRTEEQLHELNQRLSYHVDNSPLAVIEWGPDMRLVRWSGAAEQIFGWKAEEVLGKRMEDIRWVYQDDQEHVAEVNKELTTGTNTHRFSANRNYRKDGAVIHCEWYNSSLLDDSGKLRSILSLVLDVTERRAAEDALRQAKEEWERTFNSVPDLIAILDNQHRVVRANRAMARRLGLQPQECIGVSCYQAVHGMDHPLELCPHSCTIQDFQEHTAEVHEDRLGGDFLVTTTPLMDPQGRMTGAVHVARDISERKRAEKKLIELKTAIEQAGDGVAISDLDNNITFVNQSWARMHGCTTEELIGKPMSMSHTPEQMQTDVQPHLAVLMKQGTHSGEVGHVRRDGTTFPTWMTSTVLKDADQKTVGFIGVARDISERKRAEEALQQTTRELARSNKDLEQFAYVASHDLQEPLRQVTGFMNLLKERYQGKLDTKADEYIHYAVDGSTRMSSLITDLLAYSRVGSHGKAPTAVACEGTLKRAIANLYGSISESGANITHDDLPTLPADATQLTQLFQNLLGNAIKFRRPGVTPEIHVGVRREDNHWVLSVKDNGIGIDPKHADRIFQIFQRLHGMGKYPGTGIGLAICKKIVERHGGRIWVESKIGDGTTFFFSLPDSSEVVAP